MTITNQQVVEFLQSKAAEASKKLEIPISCISASLYPRVNLHDEFLCFMVHANNDCESSGVSMDHACNLLGEKIGTRESRLAAIRSQIAELTKKAEQLEANEN